MIDYTYLSWREWMPIESLDDDQLWNKLKSAPGIYIIRREKPIQRIGGHGQKGCYIYW